MTPDFLSKKYEEISIARSEQPWREGEMGKPVEKKKIE